MSKITDAVENAPYSIDWFIRRKNILDAIVPYAYADNTKRVLGQICIGDKQYLRSMFFIYENTVYVWTDLLINGLIEASQLEQIIFSKGLSQEQSIMIYQHSTKDNPVALHMLRMLRDNKLEIIEEN